MHMDEETIQPATWLCLGKHIMESHYYRCRAMMDEQGHHGLLCRENKGRYSCTT